MRATRSDFSVENFYPQSYGTIKQRNITETINFFHIAYKDFIFIFEHKFDIHDARRRVISQSVPKIQAWNFEEENWLVVLKLSYKILDRKSPLVLKL